MALARLGRVDAAPVGAHRDGAALAQLARLRAALARRVLGARGARSRLSLLAATGIVLWRVLGGRLEYESRRFRIQFAAIVLATPLVSPHLYTYDLAILVLPLILLALAMPEEGAAARRFWLVALGLLFLLSGASPRIAALIPLQFSSLASFAMLLVLLRLAPAESPGPAGAQAST